MKVADHVKEQFPNAEYVDGVLILGKPITCRQHAKLNGVENPTPEQLRGLQMARREFVQSVARINATPSGPIHVTQETIDAAKAAVRRKHPRAAAQFGF